jgi:cytoskeletal protein RodZ
MLPSSPLNLSVRFCNVRRSCRNKKWLNLFMSLKPGRECSALISNGQRFVKNVLPISQSGKLRHSWLLIVIGLIASVAFLGPKNHKFIEPESAQLSTHTSVSSQPILVTMTLEKVQSNSKIKVSTNLPDETKITATLQPPLATCSPNCGYVYEHQFSLKGGAFEIDPPPLEPVDYTLEITTEMASIQPTKVKYIIGEHGENMIGPLIKEAAPGLGKGVALKAIVSMTKSKQSHPDGQVTPQASTASNTQTE